MALLSLVHVMLSAHVGKDRWWPWGGLENVLVQPLVGTKSLGHGKPRVE